MSEQMLITEQNQYNTKDIAKWIRQTLKKEFPKYKFSVQTEYYSMGSSIHLSLMEAPIKIIREYQEITEEEITRLAHARNDSIEEMRRIIKIRQESKHHQLNQYTFKDDYHDSWNNGVFLTKEAFKILKRVVEIANKYNYDKSNSMIDYFDVNYYLHLNIGKWNKPLVEAI